MGVIQYAGPGDITEEVALGKDILRSIVKSILTKIKFKSAPGNSDLAGTLRFASEKVGSLKINNDVTHILDSSSVA